MQISCQLVNYIFDKLHKIAGYSFSKAQVSTFTVF